MPFDLRGGEGGQQWDHIESEMGKLRMVSDVHIRFMFGSTCKTRVFSIWIFMQGETARGECMSASQTRNEGQFANDRV